MVTPIDPDGRRVPDARSVHVAALDGLRGLAVVGVVAYHAWPRRLPGGFLGVDVFFVLSGYLITSLLVDEHRRTGRIGLAAFAGRRVRRLLPALLLVVVATTVWGVVVLDGAELDRLGDQVRATALYVTNWHLVAVGESYFDAFVTPSPLRHAWSLAVEEQFYVLWPAALAVLLGLRRRIPVAVTALAVAVSAVALALLADPVDPSRAYFGTDTRLYGPLVGALAALVRPLGDTVVSGTGAIGRQRWSRPVVPVGLVVVLGAFVVADDDSVVYYRGGGLVLAVVVAVLVVGLVAGAPGSSLLAARPLVALGLVSYGLYLWHWPVLVALRRRDPRPDDTAVVLAVAVSLAAALVSYLVVERPLRGGRPGIWLAGGRWRRVAPAALVPSLAVVVFSFAVLPAAPGEGTTVEQVVASLEVESMPAADGPGADSRPSVPGENRTPAAAPVVVALVGDSSAWTLGGGPVGFSLDHGPYVSPFDDDRVRLLDLGRKGWSLTPGDLVLPSGPRPRSPQAELYETEWRQVVARARPDLVVLLVGWPEIFDHRVDGETVEVGGDRHRRVFVAALDRLAGDLLTAAGPSATFVVLTTPIFPADRQDGEMATFLAGARPRVDVVNALLADLAARQPRVEVIDLGSWLCPDACRRSAGGAAARPDGVHFSPEGARMVADWLTPRLEALVAPGP